MRFNRMNLRSGLFLVIAVTFSITCRSQVNWAAREDSAENNCYESFIELEIVETPDQLPTCLNFREFSDSLSRRSEIKMMRKAGILSCRIAGEVLVNEKGEYLCHRLSKSCYLIWDLAISECLHCLRFTPGKQQGMNVVSWCPIQASWIYEN